MTENEREREREGVSACYVCIYDEDERDKVVKWAEKFDIKYEELNKKSWKDLKDS